MIAAGMDQIHTLAAQRQRHAIRIEHIRPANILLQFRGRHRAVAVAIGCSEPSGRHAAASLVVRQRADDFVLFEPAVVVAVQHVAGHLRNAPVHIPRHVFMGDETRGIRKDVAAFRMVEMAVAVDHVADRNAEPFGELLFHPGGEGRVDGIRENDAFRRHHEQRKVVVIARPIDIAFDVDDLARRPSALRRNRSDRSQPAQQTDRPDRDKNCYSPLHPRSIIRRNHGRQL
jgi:hypothetical protein